MPQDNSITNFLLISKVNSLSQLFCKCECKKNVSKLICMNEQYLQPQFAFFRTYCFLYLNAVEHSSPYLSAPSSTCKGFVLGFHKQAFSVQLLNHWLSDLLRPSATRNREKLRTLGVKKRDAISIITPRHSP